MRPVHSDINAKATAIKRFEREEGRKATMLDIQIIMLEWYGVYFKL
jgi:hypothetical protein